MITYFDRLTARVFLSHFVPDSKALSMSKSASLPCRGRLFLCLPCLVWLHLAPSSTNLSACLLWVAGAWGKCIQFSRGGNKAPAPAQLTDWQKPLRSVPSSQSLGIRGQGLLEITKDVLATHMLTQLMSRTPAVRLSPFQIPLHCWV